jgi:hypothetical protein
MKNEKAPQCGASLQLSCFKLVQPHRRLQVLKVHLLIGIQIHQHCRIILDVACQDLFGKFIQNQALHSSLQWSCTKIGIKAHLTQEIKHLSSRFDLDVRIRESLFNL